MIKVRERERETHLSMCLSVRLLSQNPDSFPTRVCRDGREKTGDRRTEISRYPPPSSPLSSHCAVLAFLRRGPDGGHTRWAWEGRWISVGKTRYAAASTVKRQGIQLGGRRGGGLGRVDLCLCSFAREGGFRALLPLQRLCRSVASLFRHTGSVGLRVKTSLSFTRLGR